MNNATAAASLYGNNQVAETPAGEFTFLAERQAKPIANSTAGDPAAVLYGGEPRQDVAPVNPSNETPKQERESAEESLYGEGQETAIEIPADIKAMRDADASRKLYSADSQYQDVIATGDFVQDLAFQGLPPAAQKAVVKELCEMASDVGMSHDDVRTYRAINRGITEMPTEDRRIEWREQAVQQLNKAYGTGAKQALDDARKFIAQDPRRAKMLEARSAGDHPDTVLLFAKLARQARAQGKLK